MSKDKLIKLIFITVITLICVVSLLSGGVDQQYIIQKGGLLFFKGVVLISLFKIFDFSTPNVEITKSIQKGNIGSAILGGAFLVGSAIVIGAV